MTKVVTRKKKKTTVFERNFECQIMDTKNAIRSKSILNQNTVKVYTDGSKLDGRVGEGFYAAYPNNTPKQAVFHLGIHGTVFQAEVLASYSKSGKEPAFGKNAQSKYCCTGG